MNELKKEQKDEYSDKLPKSLVIAFVLFCLVGIGGCAALLVSTATESSNIIADYEGEDYEYVEYITSDYEAKLYYNENSQQVLITTKLISNLGSFFDRNTTTSISGESDCLTGILIDECTINYENNYVYISSNSQNATAYITDDGSSIQEFELDPDQGFILVIQKDITVKFLNENGEYIY